MNDLTDYAMITTIAVVLLAVTQIVFLAIVSFLAFRLYKIVKTAQSTVTLTKEFVRSLRFQQAANNSVIKLMWFAARRLQGMARK